MVFDIEKIRASDLLNGEEKTHLEAVNSIVQINKEMLSINGFFEQNSLDNIVLEIELWEDARNFPNRKCYIESYSCWNEQQEYLSNDAIDIEIESKIIPLINKLFYKFINESDNVATLPISLSGSFDFEKEIVESLICDELKNKILANTLSKELETKEKKSTKMKI